MPDPTQEARAVEGGMRFVRQRDTWDCGVAALAMVCDVTYEAVLDALPSDVVARARESGGLISGQMPQLLGGLGFATRAVFRAEGAPWWDDGLRGLRLYVERSHFIVVRPDGRVNDPARGEGLPRSGYGEPLDGWEVWGPPVSRARIAALEADSARLDRLINVLGLHVARDEPGDWTCWLDLSERGIIPTRSKTTDVREFIDLFDRFDSARQEGTPEARHLAGECGCDEDNGAWCGYALGDAARQEEG